MILLGYALVAIGAAGFVTRSVEFVRITIPDNYGSNPGFGAYESMVLPWFAAGFIGLGFVLGTTWSAVKQAEQDEGRA